jgi:putative ABC transport system permease protein
VNEIFGLQASILAAVLAAILGIALAAVGVIALTSRAMFRMGLRNIRRRRAQTALIVSGLTLSTLVVTAAFATGDTINHSFTSSSYQILQRTDLAVSFNGPRELSSDFGVAVAGEQASVDIAVVAALEEAFPAGTGIAGFNPLRLEQVAAANPRTGDAVAAVQLAGFDPLRLSSLGGLRLSDGSGANLGLGDRELLVSERANRDLRLESGDILTLYVNGEPTAFTVAGIVEDELASGVLGYSYADLPGGIAMTLTAMESLLGEPGAINWISVMLDGGVRDTVDAAPAAAAALSAYLAGEGQALFSQHGLEPGRPISVEQLKADAIADGQQNGEQFITIFLALGMFAVAAGVMLVFMIFVMLAAERKGEMGIIRAVGTRRRHLVQSFLAEGTAYAVLAGIPGVVLGVLASLALTVGLLKLTGGDEFALISPLVTTKSIVIGYSLGVALTVGTVLFSSLRVSHVNIVAAIRGTEDQAALRQRRISVRWILLGTLALPVLPLGVDWLFHRGLGVRRAFLWAPMGIVAGLALMLLGRSSEQLFFFATGISMIPLCAASLAAALRAPSRAAWSAAGISLIAYWSIPDGLHNDIFGDMTSGIAMFVVSGVMMVIAATLLIVHNAPILTRLVHAKAGARYRLPLALAAGAAFAAGVASIAGDAAGGAGQLLYLAALLLLAAGLLGFAAARFSSLAPALKMAVAYPLANRFRTGMTLAMFSLVVFSLTVISIVMANFAAIDGGDTARGNLDVVLTSSGANIPEDVIPWLAASGVEGHELIAGAGRASLPKPGQLVRNQGEAEWVALPVRAIDQGFLGSLGPAIDARAEGFATDADVLAAIAANPRYVLLDRASLRGDWSEFGYDAGIEVGGADTFAPFDIEVTDETTGKTLTVTVIGSLASRLPSASFAGVYMHEAAYTEAFGPPPYGQAYLAAPDADAEALARAIRSRVATSGIDAESVASILDAEQAETRTFNRMFQAFMGLGLFVGIAGLGVIAMRSVVERRQQIGMLRAIGFQRGTVTAAFLLESAFVAVMGIVAGVSGGAVIGRNLMTSDGMTGGGATPAFTVPWTEIGVLAVVALAFALLMTWWPSRSASRVPVAEALRYE